MGLNALKQDRVDNFDNIEVSVVVPSFNEEENWKEQTRPSSKDTSLAWMSLVSTFPI